MKIFIDFDDVIFHTYQFITDLKKLFIQNGVSEKVFDETYKNFLSLGGVNMKTYDPLTHARLLENMDGKFLGGLMEDLDNFLSDTQKYIFPDVIPFLTKIGKKNSFVASYGSADFQLTKIRNAKIDQFVSDIKVSTKPKWQSIYNVARIGQISLSDDIYFIDDKAFHIAEVKEKYPQIKTILMKRPEGRYKDQVSYLADYEVVSLSDLLAKIS